MTLSADQIARLTAGHIDFKYRVYVSGPRASVALQDFVEGNTYTAFPSSTTTAALTGASTSVPVVSTAGFPASGVVVVSDGTSAPEVIGYASKTGTTFNGLTRLTPGDHNTAAGVSQWVEVTGKVTGLDLQEVSNGEVVTWALTLQGRDYDSRLLAQNNACLVMVQWFPCPSKASGWSDPEVLALGFLGAGQVDDDYRKGALWSKPVRGVDVYLEAADAPARRYGRANLAIGATATASAPLLDASLIGHAGEVVGNQPLTADNLTDDSLSTVYCSLAVPQTVPGNEEYSHRDGIFIAEVGFGPIGTGDDGAYFVLWSTKDVPMRFNNILNRQSVDGGIGVGWTGSLINTKDNEALPTLSANSALIVCRSREALESWAGPQQTEILEWRDLLNASNFTLRREGDFLALVNNFGGDPAVFVRWGDEATDTAWAGLPALAFGQALYTPSFLGPYATADAWTLTNTPVPGRHGQADTITYASVAIPPLAITLAGNINNSVTTITVTPSTAGLNQSGGRIQIDSEQIDYAAATSTTLTGCTRGVAGTTAASHTTGATVRPVDGGVAHVADRVGRIGWKRKRVLDGSGNPIVPRDFSVWTSTLTSPRYPDPDPAETDWQADWTRQSIATGHTGVEWWTPDVWGGAIACHVLLTCEAMTNGGRFLLNELMALRQAGYDPSETVAETGGDVAAQILSDFGLDSDLVQAEAFGPIGTHLVTTKGKALARLRELAGLLGGQVRVTRDNRVHFERSPWHPLAGLPELSATLDRSRGRAVRIGEGPRNLIAQVQLTVRNPETGESFGVEFPPTPRPLGEVAKSERIFYGTANEARYLAELIYRQLNSSGEAEFTPKGHADGFRAGQRYSLTWSADRAGEYYAGRNFIVTGVALSLRQPWRGQKSCEWAIRLREYVTR